MKWAPASGVSHTTTPDRHQKWILTIGLDIIVSSLSREHFSKLRMICRHLINDWFAATSHGVSPRRDDLRVSIQWDRAAVPRCLCASVASVPDDRAG